MPNYLVENRLTGEVAYAYNADAPEHTEIYPFDTFNHILQKPVVQQPVERILTKLAYLRHFSAEERITIRTAAKTNAVLEDYLSMLELADEINLDDPDTVAAVEMLEQAGLLAAGRSAEILA